MEKIFNYSNADITANLLIIKVGEGLPTIAVMPGIGESIKNGSVIQFTSPKLQLEAIDRRVVQQMVVDAEAKQYNIVALGAYSSYTKAEITGMLKYAREVLKSEQIGIIAHSNGGYGLQNQIDAVIAGHIDAIAWVAPGPGTSKTAFQTIAEAKIVNWFLTSNLDTQVNNDLGQVTENWHKAIVDAGGISFLTLYIDTTVSNEHSILSSVLTNPAMWPATGNTPVPTLTIPQFLLLNKKGSVVMAPGDRPVVQEPETIPPVVSPEPIPEPIPTPTPTIKAWNISFNAKREIFLEAIWTDDTKSVIKDTTENPFTNIYMPITAPGKERTSVTYKDKTAKALGPVK